MIICRRLRIANALAVSVMLIGCTSAIRITSTAGDPATFPLPLLAPSAGPVTTPALPPLAEPISVVATFPSGTLTLLKGSLRTQAVVDPADLAVSDLQKLVVTIKGERIPVDQLTFEPPILDEAQQVIIRFTVANRALRDDDTVSVATPSGKYLLLGSRRAAAAGPIYVNVRTTAQVLLRQALKDAGQPSDRELPEPGVERIAARLVSAMQSSASGNVVESEDLRQAVATMAKAIAGGASAADLKAMPLGQGRSGGGGGGHHGHVGGGGGGAPGPLLPAPTVTGVTPPSGPGETAITITGTDFAPGATVTVDGMPATDVVVVNDTTITAKVPKAFPFSGAKDVVVSVPGRQPLTLAGGFTVEPYILTQLPLPTNSLMIALNPVNKRIYIPHALNQEVGVFDAVSATQIGAISGLQTPRTVAVNPVTNRIYVLTGNHTVNVFDVSGPGPGTPIGTPITVPGTGTAGPIAVNPQTNRVYVGRSSNKHIWVIDAASSDNGGAGGVIGSSISVGADVLDIEVDPTTNRIYASSVPERNIYVIDGGSPDNGGAGAVIGSPIYLGYIPSTMAVDSERHRIYVTSYFDEKLLAIDGVPNGPNDPGTVIGSIDLDRPQHMAYDPETKLLYVGRNTASEVTIIDTASPANNGLGERLPINYPFDTWPTSLAILKSPISRLFVLDYLNPLFLTVFVL